MNTATRPNAIKLGNIKIAYLEFLKDVKAMPGNSEHRRRAKDRLHVYLKSIRDQYGQEIVDEIAGKKEKKHD